MQELREEYETERRRQHVPGSEVTNETSSFEGFFRANYHDVLKLAYVHSGQWHVAEEVTQEAFLRAMARWDGELRRPDAWVRTVAANLARSRMRRIGAETRALLRLAGAKSDTVQPKLPLECTEYWAAVRALPRRQAEAVALYYLEDRPVSEVATILRCAEGTVKALLHQGRRGLADALDRRDEVGS